jgi:hypothetical protein
VKKDSNSKKILNGWFSFGNEKNRVKGWCGYLHKPEETSPASYRSGSERISDELTTDLLMLEQRSGGWATGVVLKQFVLIQTYIIVRAAASALWKAGLSLRV